MKYDKQIELLKDLKTAGYPQPYEATWSGSYETKEGLVYRFRGKDRFYRPRLEELLETCGTGLYKIENRFGGWKDTKDPNKWKIQSSWRINNKPVFVLGDTLEEGLMKLWITNKTNKIYGT